MSPEAEAVGLAQSWNSLSDPAVPMVTGRWCDKSLYLKKKGHERPSARAATPEQELGPAVRPGTGTRM